MVVGLDQAHPRSFRSFAALDDIDDDLLSFAKAREPRLSESGNVDKYVIVAVVPSDEAVASPGIEPFHCAGLLDGYARR
jgi:hypothetical protein